VGEAGAKVRLVGDYAQLQAVDSGGAFGLLVDDRDDAPELVDVHRFTHAWEKTASLALRHGRTEVIDTYIGRVLDGESWTTALGTPPKDERTAATWRRHARTVATYRDRYSITGPAPLGAPAESTAQEIDAARARTALDRARDLPHDRDTTPERPARQEAVGRAH
jgi:hypothetical protein